MSTEKPNAACPKCGAPLVERTERGRVLWGCSRYQAPWSGCQFTMPRPEGGVLLKQRALFEELSL